MTRSRSIAGGDTPGRSSIRVRPAGEDDLASIAGIERRAARGANLDQVRLAIADPGRFVVVATIDDAVAGWAKTHWWPYSDGPAPVGHYLGGITVDPEARRRGVGAALTQARMDWVSGRASFVCYVVNATNAASIALHRRWGFHEVARATSFHTIQFTGGSGVLLRAGLDGMPQEA
ncbi:GNAT family N-acetyltransferase [Oerskovia enterophila]|uniref:Mycothiol acetyltransferase n=1 Tax=Oerskovia enterophila TaxID=43678 RepID=A0ABX2Y672_9CELL|nr:GNAT family N-acetyltransferase [Oerskovia enterophila]OCI30401.1 mycothiol acetyltransferase [Oerskovia enterophila]